jgi:hypothetical protein
VILLDLSRRLALGGDRRGTLAATLTLAAVAVSTVLLLFAVSANLAFQARADREAWRNPPAVDRGAVAVLAVHKDFVLDQEITVVDLAALRTGAPAPPGLARFPEPGEVWLSPALASLARELPADRLADRYPAPRGTIGPDGLVHPDELVAIVGHGPDSAALQAGGASVDLFATAPKRIRDFRGGAADATAGYQALALVAGVLMVVPLLVFGGAAARLTVARRDRRLAALRLVGATPGQVVAMTVAEAMIVAFAGAVLGLVLYAVAIPALARIEMAGGGWFVGDLWPGLPVAFGVLLAMPLLAGLSAVVGLRRVVVGPLGVARRETPPRLRFVRVLALLAALAAVPVIGLGVGIGVVVLILSLAFLAVNLVGPWVVAVIGQITARTARTPERLLAGRRLMDDPRSAWRTVGGVALTGYVAGFIALLAPAADLLGDPSNAELRVGVPAARVDTVAAAARDRLARAGITARVEVSGSGKEKTLRVLPAAGGRGVETGAGSGAGPGAGAGAGSGEDRGGRRRGDAREGGAGTGPGAGEVWWIDPALVDRTRTALHGLVPGRSAVTSADESVFPALLLRDIRTGTVIVLTVSFLVAIASSGITAASSVLDRRQTYALLRLAGTPLRVLDRARGQETLIPLTIMGGGAILVGMFCATPFVYGTISPAGVLTLAICVAVGFGGVVLAGALSRPLLRSLTAEPAPRPD